MTDAINELAGNLELIEYTVQSEYEKDADIIRATNEMNEAMDNLDIDTEDVIAKIMDLASLKFSKCKVGSNTAITDNIKTVLAIYPQKDMVDGKTIDKIVKRIRMHYDKSIQIELINGKEVERKEQKDECSIC